MFLKMQLDGYIDVAASDAPTPGGGSVAALCGALGSCMASMAANFTVGKKKYAEVEEEIKCIISKIHPLRETLLDCVEKDSIAFDAIGAAYKLPKDTDIEKEKRKVAIQDALVGAMNIPLQAMRAALECIELLPRLAEIGNKNLVSDTGVAAIFLEGAIRAAALNVDINLVAINDDKTKVESRNERDHICEKAAIKLKETMQIVVKTIG